MLCHRMTAWFKKNKEKLQNKPKVNILGGMIQNFKIIIQTSYMMRISDAAMLYGLLSRTKYYVKMVKI